MLDETKLKIMNATLKLIAEKGYTSTTTKDIAKLARVNEVTIFRKFENKKGIIMFAVNEIEWFPELKDNIFDKCIWSLETDLKLFSKIYLQHVTTEYAKVTIGLRDPQIFPDIKEYAMKLPNDIKKILIKYFEIMYERKKINNNEFETLAGIFIAINFGFVFLKVSFDERVLSIDNEKYIEESINIFAKGIGL